MFQWLTGEQQTHQRHFLRPQRITRSISIKNYGWLLCINCKMIISHGHKQTEFFFLIKGKMTGYWFNSPESWAKMLLFSVLSKQKIMAPIFLSFFISMLMFVNVCLISRKHTVRMYEKYSYSSLIQKENLLCWLNSEEMEKDLGLLKAYTDFLHP